MFGIELTGLLRLGIQLSLAVAASSALWGCVHIWKQKKAGLLTEDNQINPDAQFLTSIFWRVYLIAFTMFLLSWVIGLWVFGASVFAHEGIRLHAFDDYVRQGFTLTSWMVSLLVIATLVGSTLYNRSLKTFYKYSSWILGSQFLLASLIVSFFVWTGDLFSREQAFYIIHNWHSILTLASVIVVDIFFLFTWYQRNSIREMIYRLFPIISTGIWIGLGLDFLSVWLILDEAWNVTGQFLFSQTLVGIIIVNGALLSVRINDWLINQVTQPHPPKPGKTWQFVLGLSGAISIVSWLSITFVDFFDLDAAYWQLILVWASIVIIAFITHHFMDKAMEKIMTEKKEPAVDMPELKY